ncbi:MAG: V-type ATP synthase subunit E family protein [Candidatus Baldrarchaeia archaeon]
MGGVIVRSKDQLLTVDNTFEARLERLREQLRVNIANLLFKT